MNQQGKSLIAGLAGAAALNMVHETARQLYPQAPRVQLVGEEALVKMCQYAGVAPPTGNNLYLATLAGDLLSNALYYSLIGIGHNKKRLLLQGTGYGALAGLAALALTSPMGLHSEPISVLPKLKC